MRKTRLCFALRNRETAFHSTVSGHAVDVEVKPRELPPTVWFTLLGVMARVSIWRGTSRRRPGSAILTLLPRSTAVLVQVRPLALQPACLRGKLQGWFFYSLVRHHADIPMVLLGLRHRQRGELV